MNVAIYTHIYREKAASCPVLLVIQGTHHTDAIKTIANNGFITPRFGGGEGRHTV